MAANLLSRRQLINALLIALILILAYSGFRLQTGGNEQSGNRITALNPEDVERIRIESGSDELQLSYIENQWQFVLPVVWPAEQNAIERIVSITRSRSQSRLSAGDLDLEKFGLREPKARLTLNDTQIVFGGSNNIDGRRYLMIADSIYLLPDLHLHFLSQGLAGLADRRLIPRSLPLASLKLPQINLVKTGGQWSSDETPAASAARLNALIDQWQTRKADRVKAFSTASLAAQVIIAGLADGRDIEFYLISRNPELIIARPDLGLQYHFSQQRYDDLFSIDP